MNDFLLILLFSSKYLNVNVEKFKHRFLLYKNVKIIEMEIVKIFDFFKYFLS